MVYSHLLYHNLPLTVVTKLVEIVVSPFTTRPPVQPFYKGKQRPPWTMRPEDGEKRAGFAFVCGPPHKTHGPETEGMPIDSTVSGACELPKVYAWLAVHHCACPPPLEFQYTMVMSRVSVEPNRAIQRKDNPFSETPAFPVLVLADQEELSCQLVLHFTEDCTWRKRLQVAFNEAMEPEIYPKAPRLKKFNRDWFFQSEID